MHQSMMTKINYPREEWIDMDAIIKHSMKIFECKCKENEQHEKIGITSNFIQTKSLFSEDTSNNCQTNIADTLILFFRFYKIFLCFLICNNVNPRYYQSYKKDVSK